MPMLGIMKRHMSAAQAKWDRLTTGDLSEIKAEAHKAPLVDRIVQR